MASLPFKFSLQRYSLYLNNAEKTVETTEVKEETVQTG
jgi:hypothetical protein